MTTIRGAAQARLALDALLASVESSIAAAGALPAQQQGPVFDAAIQRLRTFINGTEAERLTDMAEVQAVAAIDVIARDAALKLTLKQVDSSIAELRAGAEKLDRLAATLNSAAASNQRAARSIRLEPAKKAVDQMTAMVESVKSLKAGLSAADADEASVLQLIDDFATKFEALQRAVKL